MASLRLLAHYHYQRAAWYSRVLQSIRTQSTDATGVAHEKAQSYVHHIGSKPLVYRNVGQHLRLAAERFPNNEAIVSCHEAGARLTYAAVLDKIGWLPPSISSICGRAIASVSGRRMGHSSTSPIWRRRVPA
uniref:AMP-dependent synthetase/ligase domain-containing protein n=1 Tax=Anopheles merus TaxID=30066 RepID=A0A182UZX0_ANOME